MAEDLRSMTTFPDFWNFTGNEDTTEIKLPDMLRAVSVGSQTKDLYICTSGATDGQAPPAHKGFIPKDNYMRLEMGVTPKTSIFVAVTSGTGEISVVLE